MKHLTLENFAPTVSTRARTDIMRLLAHARGKESVSEPQGRDLKPFELAIKSGVFEREITDNFEHLIPSGNVARHENDSYVVAFMEAWFEKLFNRPLEDEDVFYTYEVMNQHGEFEEAF